MNLWEQHIIFLWHTQRDILKNTFVLFFWTNILLEFMKVGVRIETFYCKLMQEEAAFLVWMLEDSEPRKYAKGERKGLWIKKKKTWRRRKGE